jgi:hypothetical protein
MPTTLGHYKSGDCRRTERGSMNRSRYFMAREGLAPPSIQAQFGTTAMETRVWHPIQDHPISDIQHTTHKP